MINQHARPAWLAYWGTNMNNIKHIADQMTAYILHDQFDADKKRITFYLPGTGYRVSCNNTLAACTRLRDRLNKAKPPKLYSQPYGPYIALHTITRRPTAAELRRIIKEDPDNASQLTEVSGTTLYTVANLKGLHPGAPLDYGFALVYTKEYSITHIRSGLKLSGFPTKAKALKLWALLKNEPMIQNMPANEPNAYIATHPDSTRIGAMIRGFK